MPKYIIETKFEDIKPISGSILKAIGIYKNSSPTAIIKVINLHSYHDGRLMFSVGFDSRASKATFSARLPLPLRTIMDLFEDYPIHKIYYTKFFIPRELQCHLTEMCIILDKLDPFDNEFKFELQRALGINFSFSEEELAACIEAGIDSALVKVEAHSPWQAFLLAEMYKQRFTAQEKVTEEEIRSYIKCYTLIPETDSHYKDANQNIYDFIMALELELFSEKFQFYLRGEKLRATIKLGLFEEAQHLLPSLCGYGLSYLPFPALPEFSKEGLLSLILAMAEHIKNTNEQKMASESKNATGVGYVSAAGFFAPPTAADNKNEVEIPRPPTEKTPS